MTVPASPLPAPEPDDFALMAAVRDGVDAGFAGLSARWRPRLVNFFLGLGADLHGAEDCAQETLIRVYRYRHAYRPDHPFTAFLFTLGRRAFLDWRRAGTRWAKRVGATPLTDDAEAPAGHDGIGACADRIDLAAAVAMLPRRLREVVELGAIQGLPYNRVAASLGIPVGTVKSRMHHAVERLRGLLG